MEERGKEGARQGALGGLTPAPPPKKGDPAQGRGRTRARLTHAGGGPSFHEARAQLDPAGTWGEARQNRPRSGPAPPPPPPPRPPGLTSALRVDGGLHRVHAHLHEEAIVHTWGTAPPSAPWRPPGSAQPPAVAPPPPHFRLRPRPLAPASGLAPSRPGPAPPAGARAGAGGWRRRGGWEPARLARARRRKPRPPAWRPRPCHRPGPAPASQRPHLRWQRAGVAAGSRSRAGDCHGDAQVCPEVLAPLPGGARRFRGHSGCCVRRVVASASAFSCPRGAAAVALKGGGGRHRAWPPLRRPSSASPRSGASSGGSCSRRPPPPLPPSRPPWGDGSWSAAAPWPVPWCWAASPGERGAAFGGAQSRGRAEAAVHRRPRVTRSACPCGPRLPPPRPGAAPSAPVGAPLVSFFPPGCKGTSRGRAGSTRETLPAVRWCQLETTFSDAFLVILGLLITHRLPDLRPISSCEFEGCPVQPELLLQFGRSAYHQGVSCARWCLRLPPG